MLRCDYASSAPDSGIPKAQVETNNVTFTPSKLINGQLPRENDLRAPRGPRLPPSSPVFLRLSPLFPQRNLSEAPVRRVKPSIGIVSHYGTGAVRMSPVSVPAPYSSISTSPFCASIPRGLVLRLFFFSLSLALGGSGEEFLFVRNSHSRDMTLPRVSQLLTSQPTTFNN